VKEACLPDAKGRLSHCPVFLNLNQLISLPVSWPINLRITGSAVTRGDCVYANRATRLDYARQSSTTNDPPVRCHRWLSLDGHGRAELAKSFTNQYLHRQLRGRNQAGWHQHIELEQSRNLARSRSNIANLSRHAANLDRYGR
jgi:hypothetical protein